jgi:tetratricopeptide (TPR) repeat protein
MLSQSELTETTMAAVQTAMATLLCVQGDYETAKLLTEQSLATRLQLLGEEHPDTATSLNDLATLYADQGDYIRAAPLYERALAIRERVLGPDHPSTVRVRDNLNKVQREQHRADTHGD